jgi:hypothetical protein
VHVKVTGLPEHGGQLVAWSGQWSHKDTPLDKLPPAFLAALVPGTSARDRVGAALEAAGLEYWRAEALDRLVERGDVTVEQVVTAAREAAEE